jgi:hypothetical protein
MKLLEFIHALGKLFSLSDEILILIFDKILGLLLVIFAFFNNLGLSFHELFPLGYLK